ncbi:class A sortase [Fructobacillus papyrifericola]|uniref:Class A sortase n=1 Tax=Fructobacillus papyrifericola TaxID=2713172 RepID=A0ABS5QRK8_9LACO|nr:class A sortase [Fructobacillus papyrifericola]MBS9335823.1 class A sortase [Fructobacillus papyrifericola]
MKEKVRKWLHRFFGVLTIVLIGLLAWEWVQSQPATNGIKKTANKVLTQKQGKYSKKERQAIKDAVAKQDQLNVPLNKQGFVAIPKLSILLPIYDNAYSKVALDKGANTAQKNTAVPVMGQGNYTLAAHNWDNGYTGFSALQEKLKQNAPYEDSNGQLGESDWLNGTTIYLANQNGIFKYKITGQKTVDQNDGAVLNPDDRIDGKAKLTIVTCLFPDTTKRIITNAKYVSFKNWNQANSDEVGYFDLKKQKTNILP